jgi:hypothetical protein
MVVDGVGLVVVVVAISCLHHYATVVSHPILRPYRMLIVCVFRNQVFIHIVQKIDTE